MLLHWLKQNNNNGKFILYIQSSKMNKKKNPKSWKEEVINQPIKSIYPYTQ